MLLGNTLGKAQRFCSRSKLGNPFAQEINICPVGQVRVRFDSDHGFTDLRE